MKCLKKKLQCITTLYNFFDVTLQFHLTSQSTKVFRKRRIETTITMSQFSMQGIFLLHYPVGESHTDKLTNV